MSWVVAAVAGSALVGVGVGVTTAKQNKAATQPAPDYADATVAGIKADAATLPFRLQVNQAAETGGVYTDPETGQVYDFRGRLDPVRFYKDNPDAHIDFLQNPEGRTPEQHAKDWLSHTGQPEAALDRYMTGSKAYRNQSDIEAQTQLLTAGAKVSEELANRQAETLIGKPDYAAYVRGNKDLIDAFNNGHDGAGKGADLATWGKWHYETYGQSEGRDLPTDGLQSRINDNNLQAQTDAVKKAVDLMPLVGNAQRDQDKLTFQQNLDLGLQGTRAQADLQSELLPRINQLSLDQQKAAFTQSQDASKTAFAGNLDMADTAAARSVAQQKSTQPQLNELQLRLQSDAYTAGDATARMVNGGLYAIRDEFANQLLGELKSGGDLTAAQRHKVQQRIRGAQAARGNILGDGAAFDEAIAESDFAENLVNDRRSAALGLINSRDLNPNFAAVGVVNPTQVVTPNLGPASFTATTAVNPLMPNFNSTSAPTLQGTTAAIPSLAPATITPSNPLGMLNPNAGSDAAGYGLSAWNSQANRIANAPNPWAQGIGAAAKTYSMFSSFPGFGKS